MMWWLKHCTDKLESQVQTLSGQGGLSGSSVSGVSVLGAGGERWEVFFFPFLPILLPVQA